MTRALLKRLPGRAQPREQALKEFEEFVKEQRRYYKPEYWALLIPPATDIYRWRVQLECGCIYELFMRGEDQSPDTARFRDPLTCCDLPPGEMWCSKDHGNVGAVYRGIEEWLGSRVKEFPADPVDPPGDEIDAEVWAVLRSPVPRVRRFWRVRLSCGHIHTSVISDEDWTPERGPRRVSEERAAELRTEFERYWSDEGAGSLPEGPEREHMRRMLDLRWPRPEPEQDCPACRYAKCITGCERIGWLIPKPSSKKTEVTRTEADRRKMQTRLAKIEAEARMLRRQLGSDPG